MLIRSRRRRTIRSTGGLADLLGVTKRMYATAFIAMNDVNHRQPAEGNHAGQKNEGKWSRIDAPEKFFPPLFRLHGLIPGRRLIGLMGLVHVVRVMEMT